MRTTIFIKFILSAALLTPTTICNAERPAWFDQVTVLSRGSEMSAFASGGTWGAKIVEGDWIEYSANAWHEQGGIYHGFYHACMSFENVHNYQMSSIDPSLACIDFWNNLMKNDFPWMPPESVGLLPNLHNPAWQNVLLDQVKQIIDYGADGVVMDGHMPNIYTFDQGGSFDEYTMADFREYLKANFSEEELATKFDIPDIENFNYKEWIISHGREDFLQAGIWNGPYFEGLHAQFYIFEWKYTKQFFSIFQDTAKAYAAIKYGRNFVVSENCGCAYYASVDIDDFIIGEFKYYSSNAKTTELAASQIKLLKSIGNKPFVVVPGILNPRDGFTPPENTKNLMKFILADIYAAGGCIFLCPYIDDYEIDYGNLSKYTSFILQNGYLYENLSNPARTAVAFSFASVLNRRFRFEDDSDRARPIYNSYKGLSTILIEGNIQHNVLIFRDTRFSEDRLKFETLTSYDCIILSSVYCLTDDQAQLLLDYVRDGGIVISVGDIAPYDENANLASRPVLNSFSKYETHPYGDGYFVTVWPNVGTGYFSGEHPEFKKLLIDEVNKHVIPQTIVIPENDVSVYAYNKTDSSDKILHLVNYDFDPKQDRFETKRDFTIKTLIDTSRTWEAVYVSPDFTGHKSLHTVIENDYISISIPELEAYGIVVLSENPTYPSDNLSAPLIESYSPQARISLSAGDYEMYSVNASDADGDILRYLWSIDDEIITTSFWPTCSCQAQDTASGTSILKVEISDGIHTTSMSWSIVISDRN